MVKLPDNAVSDTSGRLTVEFQTSWLNEPNHYAYELEWVDGAAHWAYPSSCTVPSGTGLIAFIIDAWNQINNDTPLHSAPNSETLTDRLTVHYEPVPSGARTSTQVRLISPTVIECDAGLGEFTVSVNSFLNAQKWWDGGTPNWRSTKQTLSIVYRPQRTVSAEFSPQTINMTGPVYTYIEDSTDLIVTTYGGTKVEVVWPDVNTVEYEQTGVWVKGHIQTVSVTDGVKKINKRIRVRSSVAGPTTISVPVSISLS